MKTRHHLPAEVIAEAKIKLSEAVVDHAGYRWTWDSTGTLLAAASGGEGMAGARAGTVFKPVTSEKCWGCTHDSPHAWDHVDGMWCGK